MNFKGGTAVASLVEYPRHQVLPPVRTATFRNIGTVPIYAGRIVQLVDNNPDAVVICSDADRAVGVAQETIEPGRYGAVGFEGYYIQSQSYIGALIAREVITTAANIDTDLTVDASGMLVPADAGQTVVARTVSQTQIGDSQRVVVHFNPVYYKA
ncbi:MAG: hypothetical protein QXZ09_05630 [Candidatus Methanomethylicaceae archaeon]